MYYGMNQLHIKKRNCRIDVSTTFNRIYLKAVTFQILFSCRPEIYRVETPETLNQGRFKSEVTWPLQMIYFYGVPYIKNKNDMIFLCVRQRNIIVALNYTWYVAESKKARYLKYRLHI